MKLVWSFALAAFAVFSACDAPDIGRSAAASAGATAVGTAAMPARSADGRVTRADIVCDLRELRAASGETRRVAGLRIAADLDAKSAEVSCSDAGSDRCLLREPRTFKIRTYDAEGRPSFSAMRREAGPLLAFGAGIEKMTLEGSDGADTDIVLSLRFALGGDGVTNVLVANAVAMTSESDLIDEVSNVAVCRILPAR